MKRTLPFFIAAVLGILGSSGAGAVELKYAHMNTPAHPVHQWGQRVAAAVAERTKGEVTFTLFPSAQLGENAQVAEQVSFGAKILTQVGPGHLAQYIPDYSILSGPFMFANWDEQKRFLDSDVAKGWAKKLESNDIKLLCFAFYGARDLYTRDKPVRTVADVKGLKLRVQPLPIYTEMVKSLGASPTPMPWAEVYSALSQGVIDAAEAPPAAMLDQKHNESVKYYIRTNHTLEPVPFILSRAVFASLKPEHQKTLEEEAQKACDWLSAETVASYEADVKKVAERGVTVISDVDRPSFVAATRSVYNQFPKWTPNLYEIVRKAIAN